MAYQAVSRSVHGYAGHKNGGEHGAAFMAAFMVITDAPQ